MSLFFKNTIILFVVPPKFCISIVFSFSWDLQSPQEKLETMLMKNFGGTKKSIMVFLKKAHLKLPRFVNVFDKKLSCRVDCKENCCEILSKGGLFTLQKPL